MNDIVHIVDDDIAIRDALSWLFRSRGVTAISWESGEDFLKNWTPDFEGCILLDLRMKQLSGIEVFDRLLEKSVNQPVIFLTGHGDIALAVSTLKQGAADFIEKPFNDNDLVDRVLAANAASRAKTRLKAQSQEEGSAFEAGLRSLSAREHEVFELIVKGYANKRIADHLQIAMRTVEVHRARVLEKMRVRNAVELTRLVMTYLPASLE